MSLTIALDVDVLRERCEVTSVRIVRGEPEYENGAVLPSGPWSPIALGIAERLAGTVDTPDDVLVELIKAERIDRAQLDRVDVTQLGTADSPAMAVTTTPNYRLFGRFRGWGYAA